MLYGQLISDAATNTTNNKLQTFIDFINYECLLRTEITQGNL